MDEARNLLENERPGSSQLPGAEGLLMTPVRVLVADDHALVRQGIRSLLETEVLILTMHESEKTMRDVLQAGARGYVLKSEAPSDLLASIQALHKHNPSSS